MLIQKNNQFNIKNLIVIFWLLPLFILLIANASLADEQEIRINESYIIEVENRKSSVLEAQKELDFVNKEVEKLEAEKAERESLVSAQDAIIQIKKKEVEEQEKILQAKLNELTVEEKKSEQLMQNVLRKETEIDSKKVEYNEQIQKIARLNELVEQAVADVNRQKQLVIEQKQAEQREAKKRELLKQLETIRANLSELGVSFTGATVNAVSLSQSQNQGNDIVNSKLKQCERNSNLVDNRDGTIFDRSTDLMWSRCSLGEKYDPDSNICLLYPMASNNFNISERLRTFNQEQEFLNRYSRDRGGSSYYSDWKLPSITELKTLIKEPCAQDPSYYYSNLFDTTKKDRYMSGSLNNEGKVIFLDFKDGQTKADIPESSGYIRLVR